VKEFVRCKNAVQTIHHIKGYDRKTYQVDNLKVIALKELVIVSGKK
jgi:hypothetical protein